MGGSEVGRCLLGQQDCNHGDVVPFPPVFQLDRAGEHFTVFYRGQHEGRKLTWLFNLSRVRQS